MACSPRTLVARIRVAATPSGSSSVPRHVPIASAWRMPAASIWRRNSSATTSGGWLSNGLRGPTPGSRGGTTWMWTSVMATVYSTVTAAERERKDLGSIPFTEHHQVVPADAHAGLGVQVRAECVHAELAGRDLGDIQGRLTGRDVAGGHQEVDVGLWGDIELAGQVHFGPALNLPLSTIDHGA